MRQYLANIHKQSDHHKKNFALGVSGIITLFIFAIWLFVNFGQSTTVAQDGTAEPQLASAQEVSPLESIGMSLSSSWQSLTGTWGEFWQSINGLDLNTGYQELKQNTLDTYGR